MPPQFPAAHPGPAPAIFSRPVTPVVPAKRLAPELEELQNRMARQVADIASRLKLVEQRIDNLRSHIELTDRSLVEKHKTLVSEIRDVQDGMRSLRADIDMIKDLSERMAKRMEDFASREDVKVLQRYVEMWQPLQFVTRAELKALLQNVLKEPSS